MLLDRSERCSIQKALKFSRFACTVCKLNVECSSDNIEILKSALGICLLFSCMHVQSNQVQDSFYCASMFGANLTRLYMREQGVIQQSTGPLGFGKFELISLPRLHLRMW